MLLTLLPAVLVATVILFSPGVIWAWWCYPALDGATRLAVGLALGFAFQVHACALLAWGPGITRESVLITTAGGVVAASVLAWRARVPHTRLSNSRLRIHSMQLGAVLAAVAVPRLFPLLVQQIPGGWDPSFHSLLASTTLTSHLLPTWSPFEQISSNYPYGPHVLIAEIGFVTGIAPDRVFSELLNGILPTLTCLALYPLGRRVLRGHGYGLATVAAYGLLGNWGSIEYVLWGGLPNELGFFLVLVFLVVLFGPAFEIARIVVGGVILGAIPLAHHHVMLTTVILVCAYAGYLIARWLRSANRPAQRRQLSHAFARLTIMAGIAVVTVSYYVIPILLRVGSLGNTTVAEYTDEFFGTPFEKNGWLLWILAVTGGVLLTAAVRERQRRYPKPGARYAAGGAPGLARAFVVTATASLAAAFVLFFFGYRTYSLYVSSSHQPYTLFTPSRFLTDMTYFLAFFAAIPLVWLWRHGPVWVQESVVRDRPFLGAYAPRLTRVLISGVLLYTAVGTLHVQSIEKDGHLAPGEAQAFEWIRTHTPADTLVVNLDPNARWAPYFTQREVAYTPVPVSEFTAGYVDEKHALSSELMSIAEAAPPLHVTAFAGTGDALASVAGRPVAVLLDRPMQDPSASLVYTAGAERVYLLGYAFRQLAIQPDAHGSIPVQWWPRTDVSPPVGWSTLNSGDAAQWGISAPELTVGKGTLYLRLLLPGALPAGGRLICRMQSGGTLYVDGSALADPCTGSPVGVTGLVKPGPHVVAVRATFSAGMDPWINVILATPSAPA